MLRRYTAGGASTGTRNEAEVRTMRAAIRTAARRR